MFTVKQRLRIDPSFSQDDWLKYTARIRKEEPDQVKDRVWDFLVKYSQIIRSDYDLWRELLTKVGFPAPGSPDEVDVQDVLVAFTNPDRPDLRTVDYFEQALATMLLFWGLSRSDSIPDETKFLYLSYHKLISTLAAAVLIDVLNIYFELYTLN